MRKPTLLFIILISLVFSGCTVQGDEIASINKELSSVKAKVAELEVENSKLKAELQHIKAESEQKQIIIDEFDSAADDKTFGGKANGIF